ISELEIASPYDIDLLAGVTLNTRFFWDSCGIFSLPLTWVEVSSLLTLSQPSPLKGEGIYL
ncbi:MAG TPA: hypothetical protein VMX95_01555, partial [Thermodesulfobacteriota bacterium]|nr:hypothetical protein [Thermodesulfobacteriota bacterium]